MDDRMGDNINGPSLIRVPDWIPNALGKYYLYFAHHQGTYIRLAYADQLEGPWRLYTPGVLELSESIFNNHIASPDVHVLNDSHEIRMYYHGCCLPRPPHQATCIAISHDGLTFTSYPDILGSSYWRVFYWQGYWYTLEMPGTFRRSLTGISDFEEGPKLFNIDMRHSAIKMKDESFTVFYSNVNDYPERILQTSILLDSDWLKWQTSEPSTLLTVEMGYEGVNCPVLPSERGSIQYPVHQLRDPCVFEDDGKTYLLYSIAGEHGIAIGEITEN